VNNIRIIWLAIILLAAAMVGCVGGLLSWLGGMNPANAVLAGAGSFGSAILLILSMFHFVTGPKA
jgi:hypothetical protein